MKKDVENARRTWFEALIQHPAWIGIGGWGLGALLAVGVALRLYRFGSVPIGIGGWERALLGDGVSWLTGGDSSFAGALYAIAFDFFRVNAEWSRWLSILASLGALAAVTSWCASRFGRRPATLGAAFVLFDPLSLYWSRFANPGIIATGILAATFALAGRSTARHHRLTAITFGYLIAAGLLISPAFLLPLAALPLLTPIDIGQFVRTKTRWWTISGFLAAMITILILFQPFDHLVLFEPPGETVRLEQLPQPLTQLNPDIGFRRLGASWITLVFLAWMIYDPQRPGKRHYPLIALFLGWCLAYAWPPSRVWLQPLLPLADLGLIAAAVSSLSGRRGGEESSDTFQRRRGRAAFAVILVLVATVGGGIASFQALSEEWFRGESVAAHEFERIIRTMPLPLTVYHGFEQWRDLGGIANYHRMILANALPADPPLQPQVRYLEPGRLADAATASHPEIAPCALLLPVDDALPVIRYGLEQNPAPVWEAPYEHQSLQVERQFAVLFVQGQEP